MNKTLVRLYDEAGINPDNLKDLENAILINEQTTQALKEKMNNNFYTYFLTMAYNCELISNEEYEYFNGAKEDEIYGGLLGILSSKKFSANASLPDGENSSESLIDIFINELRILESTRKKKTSEKRLRELESKLILYKELHQVKKENKVLRKRRKYLMSKSKNDN